MFCGTCHMDLSGKLTVCCVWALNFIQICYVQVEEQLRNSKMLDLLYVHGAHNLAPHILSYYQYSCQLPLHERPALPIDPRARLVNMFGNGHQS